MGYAVHCNFWSIKLPPCPVPVSEEPWKPHVHRPGTSRQEALPWMAWLKRWCATNNGVVQSHSHCLCRLCGNLNMPNHHYLDSQVQCHVMQVWFLTVSVQRIPCQPIIYWQCPKTKSGSRYLNCRPGPYSIPCLMGMHDSDMEWCFLCAQVMRWGPFARLQSVGHHTHTLIFSWRVIHSSKTFSQPHENW